MSLKKFWKETKYMWLAIPTVVFLVVFGMTLLVILSWIRILSWGCAQM